jgi:acetyl-CoA synthetase
VTFATIRKPRGRAGPAANLADYDRTCERFRWQNARKQLAGLPGGALNIAHEAVDRHIAEGLGERLALRWLGRDSTVRDFSYAQLAAETSRFAALLTRFGVVGNDAVFALLGRVPELYIAALGTLKAGAVFSPLFSAFGPTPVQQRMTIGNARALVTTQRLYERKVQPWRHKLPDLKLVLLTECDGELPPDCASLEALLDDTPADFVTVSTRPDDLALLHFTSGTTGQPKGAMHVHEAVVAHHITGVYALDLHPEDVFWCTADPGWVTGTSYGIISPLTIGCTLIVDQAEFDAERWYRILQDQKVTVWYTAPTAIRTLMRVGDSLRHQYDLSALRFLASVGEPLNAEAVIWSNRVFGRPFHDNWWQTETGGIMIANYASMDIKPGSMGKPLPGVVAGIVEQDQNGKAVAVQKPMTVGELALQPGWPSMFRGYLNAEERYRKSFSGDWYLTGDLAMRDEDGYYWFVGRADDMIKSAGHLIGPFEVESSLMSHPAVAEAAVIGVPDERMGEAVKAFVSLKPGQLADEALRRELLGFARKALGPTVAPREIEFRDRLPKTRSGKIMRRLLKARELGLPEGDTSALENTES